MPTKDFNLNVDFQHNKLLNADLNRPNTDGMGYIILRKDLPFAEQLTQENTIYEIRYDFDLGNEEINVPVNSILDFQGGSLSNGIIRGNDTFIKSNVYSYIFKENLYLLGHWQNNECSVCWFGAKSSLQSNFSLKNIDVTSQIQRALDVNCENGFGVVFFPCGAYYITETLKLEILKNIKLEGISNGNPLYYISTKAVIDYAIIYSNLNIDILNIDIKTPQYNSNIGNNYAITIEGGQLDVSFSVKEYTSNILSFTDINLQTKLWGVNIRTSLIAHPTLATLATNSSAINFNFQKGGYATMIRIKCLIKGTHYGVKDTIFNNGSWVTDIIDESVISCRCAIQFNSAYNNRILGSYQCVSIFPIDEAGDGLIEFNRDGQYMGGVCWDCNMTVGDKHTNRYAVVIGELVKGISFGELSSNLIGRFLVSGGNQIPPNFSNANDFLVGPAIKSVETKTEGAVTSVENIDFIFSQHAGASAVNMDLDNFTEGSLEISIEIAIQHITQIAVMSSCVEGFYNCFKKIKCNLYNNEEEIYSETLCVEKYIGNSLPRNRYSLLCFNVPYGKGYANKIKLVFFEPAKGTFGNSRFLINKIYAVALEKGVPYITKDGVGANYLQANNVPKLFWGLSLEQIQQIRPSLARDILAILPNGVHCYNANGWGIPLLQDSNITTNGGYDLPTQTPTSAVRPTFYEDITASTVLSYHAGKGWREYDGATPRVNRANSSENKPNSKDIYKGFQYFDTTLNKPIWWNGTNWVDGMGNIVEEITE